MKKKFIEPEIVRIEVKMTENIATSGEVETEYAHGSAGIPLIIMTKIGSTSCYDILINTGNPPRYDIGVHEKFTVGTEELQIALGAGCYKIGF